MVGRLKEGRVGPAGSLVAVLAGAAVLLLVLSVACGDDGGGTKPEASSTAAVVKEKGATITVNSTKDVDARDGELTLREALLLASGDLAKDALEGDERGQVDGSPGPERADHVAFDESVRSGEGETAIALGSGLPALTGGGDTIDGKGQVTIDGGDKTLTCFTLASDNNVLKGLHVHKCRTAVLVQEGKVGSRIGAPGEGNVLSGNVVGVEVRGRGAVIQANIIGLDAAGSSAMSNEFEGVWVTSVARDAVIGGAESGQGNVISGNLLFGLSVEGAQGTVIQGNIIGLDAAGRTKVTNRFGIAVQLGARGTLIGGDTGGARNVIAGNATGILVQHTGTEGNTIAGNYIGTDIDGTIGIPNGHDVLFVMAERETNTVGENFSLAPLNIEEQGR